MGKALGFRPARLVVGLLVAPGPAGAEAARLAEAALEARFGAADRRGPELPFAWSGYYDAEMGGRPTRGFLSFPALVDPSALADIKTWSNRLEDSLAGDGARRVNLDPGILSLSSLVLATTKDRPHRVPLAGGIYAELTLLYEAGDYRPLPWTYPDWASEDYRSFLRSLRAELKAALRGG